MFKKRKNLNQIRQRRLSEEEAAIESDATAIASNDDSNSNFATLVKKEKKKVKEKSEQKKQSILSFEDELEADDGIIFQEKKSSLSYKLRKEMKKERKEKRKEEKEKQRQAEGKDKFRDKDKNGGPTVSELDELGIRIVNGREAESIGAKPGDSDEDDPNIPGKHKFRSRKLATSQSLDPWKKILQSGQIPDANMIHAIRKQRQQAREQGDVIPIDDTLRFEETKTSRLVRDDDNDRSDEDEDVSRMDFSVNQQAKERQQRQEAFNAAQEGGSDNSDHEREWEKQQLLKAGANAKVAGGGDGELNPEGGDSSTLQFTSLDNGTNLGNQDQRLWGTETLIPSSSASLPRPSNYQAEGIIKRLQDR